MAEDFLSYLQMKAAKPNLVGPGNYGFATGRGLKFAPQQDFNLAPPTETDGGGGILDAVNPFSSNTDWGMRLLDILSRGNYAASNMFQEGVREVRAGDPSLQNGESLGVLDMLKAAGAGFNDLGQAWQGLSGQQKITGHNVVEDALGKDAANANGFGKGVAGLAIDIFGDPTSYIGPGLVKSAIKGLGFGAKASEEAIAAEARAVSQAALAQADEAAGRLPLGDLQRVTPEYAGKSEKLPKFAPPKDQGEQLSLFDTQGTVKPSAQAPVATAAPAPAAADIVAEAPNLAKQLEDVVAKVKADVAKAPEPTAPRVYSAADSRLAGSEAYKGLFTPSEKIIQQVKDYKLNPPVGSEVSTFEKPWVAEGSTSLYAIPSSTAADVVKNMVAEGKVFETTAKTLKGNPKELAKSYNLGEIRPPVDTTAERILMEQVNAAEFRAGKKNVPVIPFHILDPETRKVLTSGGVKYPSYVRIKAAGEIQDIPSNDLWQALNGNSIQIGDRVFTPADIQVADGTTGKWGSIGDVAKQTTAELNSKEFWAKAAGNTKAVRNNPKAMENFIVKAHRTFIQQSMKITYDDLGDWMKQAKALYPELSDEALKAAHDAAKGLLDDIWTSVREGKITPEQFRIAAQSSQDIQNTMASAIARHASPEELIADIAVEKQRWVGKKAQAAVNKIKKMAADREAKAALSTEVMKQVDEAAAEVKVADAAAEAAPVARMAEAQKASESTVATKVRQAENYSGLSDDANAIINSGGFGAEGSKLLSADDAVGLVKENHAAVVKSDATYHNGYGPPELANVVNRIRKMLANTPEVTAVVKAAAGKKIKILRPEGLKQIMFHGPSGPAAIARVQHTLRATEHQLADKAGLYPNVWLPGAHVVHPFSAARLLDEMIVEDLNLARTALFGTLKDSESIPHWSKLVRAAVFKDPESLASIKDPVLRKWINDYDPTANIALTTEEYATKVAGTTSKMIDASEARVADSLANDSPARAAMVADDQAAVAKDTVKRTPSAPIDSVEGISEAADSAAKDVAGLAKTIVESDPVAAVSTAKKGTLAAAGLADARGLVKANVASRAAQKAAGSGPIPGATTVSALEMDKSFKARLGYFFRTSYGAKETRPIMESGFNYVSDLMSGSTREWRRINETLKTLPNGGLNVIRALDNSTGSIDNLTDAELAVHREMRAIMEKILSGSGVEKFVAGNSASTKMALPMENLNSWLLAKGVKGTDGKTPFQFMRQDVKLPHGEVLDYSKGNNWLKEWEHQVSQYQTAEEATRFLHGIEQAMYSAGVERMIYDDLAVRFGVPNGQFAVDHGYLSGVTFATEEIATQVRRMGELINELQKPLPSSNILRMYDQALRFWKTGMTIYNPSHHVRNAAGDLYLGFADGMKPSHLVRSGKLMNEFRGAKFDLSQFEQSSWARGMSLNDLRDREGLIKKITAPPSTKVVVKNRSSGKSFDGSQVIAGFHANGGFQGAGVLEDIQSSAKNFQMPQPLGGRVKRFATQSAEGREHSIRLAHFIHALEDTHIPKLKGMTDAQHTERLFQEAARRVRRYHPDGLDLTAAEKKYMRRAIPFYSWYRKAIPMILLSAVHRPGLALAYPKLQRNVTYANGVDTPDGSYLPGDQLLPDWIMEQPWMFGGSSLMAGGAGYTAVNGPSTPFNDLIPMLNNPIGDSAQMLTPFARIPAEILSGSSFGTGIPTGFNGTGDNADKLKYLSKQLPGPAQAAFRMFAPEDSAVGNKNKFSNDFINWLGAAGIVETGKYQKSAEFDLRDRLKKGINNAGQ